MLRLLPALLLMVAACATAQPSRTLVNDDWCAGVDRSRGDAVVCEVRETVLAASPLTIETEELCVCGVHEWDRTDVLVRTRVVGRAGSQGAAERLVQSARTVIDARPGALRLARPEGPDGVEMAVEVFGPRDTGFTVRTANGTTVNVARLGNTTSNC